MSKNEISHKGVIKSITPELTTVEILSTSACAECHAKGMCGMSESKVKEISVPTDPYSVHEVGDEVQVMLKKSMGLKAVWKIHGVESCLDILCDSFVHFNDFNIIFVVR